MLVSQMYHLYRGAKIHNQQFYPTQFPILPLSPIFLDNGYAKFLLFIVCGFMSICTNHCHVYKSHSKPSRSIQISENLLLSPKSDQISFQPILTVNCKFIHLDFNMKYHHIFLSFNMWNSPTEFFVVSTCDVFTRRSPGTRKVMIITTTS